MEDKPWESDNCSSMRAHYAVYSVPQAAALWCGVPEDQVSMILQEATQLSPTGFGRGVWTHPVVPCLEPRSRAIADAIEKETLPHGREDGESVASGEHVAYERRHVFGRDLKEWMERDFPNEKPAFLFDDIERNSHSSISADSYRAMKAERDTLKSRIDRATESYKQLRGEKEAIESERDSLKAMVENLGAPGERAETTYQNIIAALLDCISGDLPNIEKHASFETESKLIDVIENHYKGYAGLSKSNLSRKFPDARRKLKSQ